MDKSCGCDDDDLNNLYRSKNHTIKLRDQKIQELEFQIQQTRKELKKTIDETNYVRKKIEESQLDTEDGQLNTSLGIISNVSDRVKGVDQKMLPRRIFFGMDQIIDQRKLEHEIEKYFGPVEKLSILSTKMSGFITFESPTSYFNAINAERVRIEGIRVYFSKVKNPIHCEDF
ncbi:6648_t:CDS:2 [Ambispora leptoticha]|uniref:6648_t:CDS:1 n=1 Tax=Ambispora leptoticha TaxID=144679 RepID=A0A9N9CFL4_9GLOM|nr:6648_t:CDS:2 [Ambispora leptoticha]